MPQPRRSTSPIQRLCARWSIVSRKHSVPPISSSTTPGCSTWRPITEYPEEKWDRLVGVMLTGTFLCTKYALPAMINRRWGRIINIASAHGLVASPFKSAYVSSKHGIVGFTKVAAWEVAESGVTVNAVCPGYVRTPLVESQIADQARVHRIPQTEVVEKIMLQPAAVKQLIEPGDVAALVRYLCTDEARMITGAALSIDAGWTAR